MQTPAQPQDLITLQWIIIVTLATVIGFLYRQLLKANDNYQSKLSDLMEKMLTGLSENSEAITELSQALDALGQQFSLRSEIEELRREVGHDKS